MTAHTIKLKPAEHRAPRCENPDDEAAVRDYEREVREHRAHVEPFTLTRADDRVDTTWWVSGESGNRYPVDIVDGLVNDTCGCPDFLSNEVGTCKHLEAVRRAIHARPALRRERQRLSLSGAAPTVTVDGYGPATLSLVGDWTARRMELVGVARDPRGLTVVRPERFVAGEHPRGVRVTHAAALLAGQKAQREALRAQRRMLSQAIERGRLKVDVLTAPLFPYQVTGAEHLLRAGRALLADDMGLGKTVQAIAACEVLRARGDAARILVVTSASLKDQWAREIERYAGVKAVVVGGGLAARTEALQSDAPYKILNYELTWRELERIQRLDADVLILDEAQRAKNFRTKTAATLRSIPSRHLFVLTGTPVENRLDDLYSLLQLIDPAVLGPLWRFNLDFHERDARGKVVRVRNLTALRERVAPVVLRRRKEEVLTQLPPLTEQTRYTPLSDEQQQLEGALRMDALKLVRLAERRPLTREEHELLQKLLMKARQACDALELADPKRKKKASPKLDEFESLVSEIAAQGTSKLLVFSEWVGMLRLAAERLDNLGVTYTMLHGGVAVERRAALLDRFREDRDVRVLLCSDAGGTGLNLQVATYVVHLDLPWNPARLDQRTARAHRLGQTRGVSVTYLCSERGIERGIEGTLASKRAVRAGALDLGSDIETVDVVSFNAFLVQLQAAIQAADVAREGEAEAPVEVVAPAAVVEETLAEVVELDEVPALEAPVALAAMEVATEAPVSEAPVSEAPVGEAPVRAAAKRPRAQNRLQLARLVLDAGFAADAVKASYDALAAAIGAMLEGGAPGAHAALVAAVYRELVPSGRLPAGAHAALARLHDLASLDALGVEVDEALAREAVDEASAWVERLGSQQEG